MSTEFMRRAVALAYENIRTGGGPFAALIVKNHQVVAQGVNRVAATNDPTAHAEVVAIREACKALGTFQLTGCDLHELRTLPHVPGRHLLGAARAGVLRGNCGRRCRRGI